MHRGAWVRGKISVLKYHDHADANRRVTLRGPGVLDGSYFDYQRRKEVVEDQLAALGMGKDGGWRPFTVRGLTCYNPSNWCVTELPWKSHVQGYKALAWFYNNDGMGLAQNSTAEDLFIRVNDDSFKFEGGAFVTARRLVVWQGWNGSPFQMGWNGIGCQNCLVEDSDVIHAEWQGYVPAPGTPQQMNDAVLDMHQTMVPYGTTVVYSNVTMRDIRVDGTVGRLVGLLANETANEGRAVHVDNVVVQDIVVRKPFGWLVPGKPVEQFLIVADQMSWIRNVSFMNVTVAGTGPIRSAADWPGEGIIVRGNVTGMHYS
eukprot:Hpha_TRINITY_DN8624_c0_g1::TRINITY_DN8624_c0_g1_i2::g.168764::m.168764